MQECEDSEYSAERAKVLYKRFDKFDFPELATLKREDWYEKAKDLLRLLVPAPHMSDPSPAGDRQQPKDSDDDQDDQDQDDPADDEEKTDEADTAQWKTGSSTWKDWNVGTASGSWKDSSS